MHTVPLSLYIHIPWCVRKCPYCDFNSHEAGSGIDEAAYIAALTSDLESDLGQHDGRALTSIFFGGGTPSLFSASAIESILEMVHRRIDFDTDIEISLEANPGTAEQDHFYGYRRAGVNRLSIGIQSFNDRHLASLGRIHDRNEAMRAIDAAARAGFDNFNLDLMFGLPGQTAEDAVADMQTAVSLSPAHLSCYQLTIEPNTLFHKQVPTLPDTETIWEMQQHCQALLRDNRYQQYEVSAFAQPGSESRHNRNYWEFGDYIGIGAGAHGKLTHGGKITRRWKRRQPAEYIKHALSGGACSGTRTVAGNELVFEFMLNALRLKQGFSFETFVARTGISRDALVMACDDIDTELLEISDAGIKASQKGYNFLNDILERLLDTGTSPGTWQLL